MPQEPPRPGVLARINAVIIVLLIGMPTFVLLTIFTWGAILAPLPVAVFWAPLFLLHYVFWGRSFSKANAGEIKVQFWSNQSECEE